jgi:hypothetical protein
VEPHIYRKGTLLHSLEGKFTQVVDSISLCVLEKAYNDAACKITMSILDSELYRYPFSTVYISRITLLYGGAVLNVYDILRKNYSFTSVLREISDYLK